MMSSFEDDCKTTCIKSGLVCEPSFFPTINNYDSFEKLNISCKNKFVPLGDNEEIDYPAYDNSTKRFVVN